jgi:hypothetical protein
MEQGLVWGIVGTVATLVFGAWGIYLAIRQRYPGRLLFVKEDCIGLFDSIVRNLPELSVQFKGAPVKENLVLLKGFFLNTGSKDISQGMVVQRLRAVLPEEYRWLTAKVVAASPAVKAEVGVASETALEFDLGLFRCGEYLKFEALVEVPTAVKEDLAPADILQKSLGFDHRIADTGKIEEWTAPVAYSTGDKVVVRFAPILVALMIILLYSVFAEPSRVPEFLRPPAEQNDIGYVIYTNGRRMLVDAARASSETVKISEIAGEFRKEISVRDFNAMKPEIVVFPEDRWLSVFLQISVTVTCLLLLAAVFIIYVDYFKRRELRRLLLASEGEISSSSEGQHSG